MNTNDRAVVKALLQKMTDKCLTGSDEFRAALVYFNITTTFEFDRTGHWGTDDEYIVDVFAPGTIAAGSDRHVFNTAQEAKSFAMNARATGDEPVNQCVVAARALNAERLAANIEAAHAEALEENDLFDGIIRDGLTPVQRAIHIRRHGIDIYGAGFKASVEAAHAEALEMDAEFNFERVSREINTGVEPDVTAPVDEPDAITVTEALAIFVDRYVILDAQAVGKRYIVAFPSSCHEGKLIKHGSCYTREDAQTLLNNLASTRGITNGQLIVLKLQ